MSLLVESENLGEFCNILTADGKYSRHNRENFPQLVQMQLFLNQKRFVNFSMHFWNLHQVLNI